MNKIKKIDIAKILMGLGVWLRGRGLATASIWYDEAYSLNLAQKPILAIPAIASADFNPPLNEILIKPFATLSGPLWASRIPSLLASIAGLWILWLIMDELEADDHQRIWVAALTLLPINYWMAQDARIYSILGMLYLLACLMLIRGQWLGLMAAAGLMLYGHSLGLVFVCSLPLIAWGYHRLQGLPLRETIRSAGVTAAGLALGLPGLLPLLMGDVGLDDHWIPAVLSLDYLEMSWAQALFAGTAYQLGLLGKMIYLLLYFYVLIGLAITLDQINWPDPPAWVVAKTGWAGEHKDPDLMILFGALVFWIPLLAMIAGSLLIHNVLYYRPLTLLALPLALWLGSAAAPLEIRPIKMILPGLMALGLLATNLAWDPASKGGDLERAAELVDQHPGPVLYATGTAALPFDLYLDQPGYIAEDDHHAGLLQPRLQAEFGWEQRDPGPWAEWMIWPQDELISPELWSDLEALTESMELVAVVDYWQAAEIEIWRQKQ